MKTFGQLIRLHRYRLLDKQKQLAKLEAESAELKRQSDHLEAEALIEEARAEESSYGVMAFANYFERVKQRRFALNEERAALFQRVLSARAALRGAFQELKRIEILRDQKIADAEAAEKKAEQATLDEIALLHRNRD